MVSRSSTSGGRTTDATHQQIHVLAVVDARCVVQVARRVPARETVAATLGWEVIEEHAECLVRHIPQDDNESRLDVPAMNRVDPLVTHRAELANPAVSELSALTCLSWPSATLPVPNLSTVKVCSGGLRTSTEVLRTLGNKSCVVHQNGALFLRDSLPDREPS